MANKLLFLYRYLNVLMLLVFVNISHAKASSVDAQTTSQKVLQIAVTDIPKSLYPYATNALPEQYSHLFFDPLVRWGQQEQLQYRLIEKLETVHDKKTRFYLKKNIYFHSGNLLTSKDVIWSVKKALKKKFLDRKLQNSIKITRINNFQFEVESQLTQAQLLDYLTHVFILDSVYYAKNKIDDNRFQGTLSPPIKQLPLSGTGPYKIVSFYADVHFSVTENTRYWQRGPSVTSINFMKIRSPDSRLYALLANDIDISEDIASKKISSLALSGNKDVYKTSTINTLFLSINQQKNATFTREIARNAIHLAINQSGMLKHILNGTGDIERVFKVNNPSPQLPAYDVKRAKTILKKISAPRELSLLVMADNPSCTEEVVVALTNMLKKVGITLKITEVSTIAEWKELQFTSDLTLSMWRTSLIEESIIYQDIFTNSLISDYLTIEFDKQEKDITMEDRISLFEEIQSSDKIIPLFSKHKVWAADNHYDLTKLFSINGIPYWHQLKIK